jgi:hypothetical protein
MNAIPRVCLALTAALFFSACGGGPQKIIIKPDASEKAPGLQSGSAGRILDYQDANSGGPIPEWAGRYLEGGNRAVEGLDAYRGSYVFVGSSRGSNFKALGHWAGGFSAEQDFPRLAALRMEARLTGAAALYPDDEYGEFFEALVKKASDAAYTGAVKESTFWIFRQYRQGDEEDAPIREQYEFLVLTLIEKSSFQAQARALMGGIRTTVPPTREQAVAINRIKETFFDDF